MLEEHQATADAIVLCTVSETVIGQTLLATLLRSHNYGPMLGSVVEHVVRSKHRSFPLIPLVSAQSQIHKNHPPPQTPPPRPLTGDGSQSRCHQNSYRDISSA
jgi:hypothetical protein